MRLITQTSSAWHNPVIFEASMLTSEVGDGLLILAPINEHILTQSPVEAYTFHFLRDLTEAAFKGTPTPALIY